MLSFAGKFISVPKKEERQSSHSLPGYTLSFAPRQCAILNKQTSKWKNQIIENSSYLLVVGFVVPFFFFFLAWIFYNKRTGKEQRFLVKSDGVQLGGIGGRSHRAEPGLRGRGLSALPGKGKVPLAGVRPLQAQAPPSLEAQEGAPRARGGSGPGASPPTRPASLVLSTGRAPFRSDCRPGARP